MSVLHEGPNLIVAGDWSGRRDMRGSVSSMVSDHIRRLDFQECILSALGNG